MKGAIKIIHSDEDIIVLNKPPQWLTIPDRYAPERANLIKYLEKDFGKVFIVHRLDKDTSGVICFARNEAAHRSISMQFQNRETDKFYHAIVLGTPSDAEGRIEKSLAPHPGQPTLMTLNKKGKQSLTLFKTMESFGDYSLIQANIKTGRMHQIRVHFKSIGHPLAVDPKYGGKEAFFVSAIKGKKYRKGKDEVEKPLTTRLTLHAYELSFDHPSSGERVSYVAEYPKDFRAVLAQLRKWRGR